MTTKFSNNTKVEPVALKKKIGTIDFEVAVHFSKTSKRTMEDKILRLIESEVHHNAVRFYAKQWT